MEEFRRLHRRTGLSDASSGSLSTADSGEAEAEAVADVGLNAVLETMGSEAR